MNLGDVVVRFKADTADFQRSISTVKTNLKSIGTSMQTVGKKMTMGVTLPLLALGAGIGYASIKAAGFDKKMREVFTLLPGITEDAMTDMTESVKRLAREMGISAEEVASALYQAVSAGVPREDVFEFMEIASKAAIGGVTDLETAVDGITSVVNAYGASVIDATRASDILFTAVRLGKCVVGSTRVLLSDGRYERIDNLQDGGEIISFDGRAFVPMHAEWVEQGVKRTVKLKTRLGKEIVTTWNHPYLTDNAPDMDSRSTRDPVWKKVSELEVGDRIAIPTSLPFFGEKEVPEEVASLLGLWLAEGASSSSSPRISTTKYGDEVRQWSAYLGCETHNVEKRKGFCPSYLITTGRNGNRENPVQEMLKRYGLANTSSGEKHIPEEVFTWNRKSISILLRWLFNGDGWLCNLHRWGKSGFQLGFVSKSERLVRDVSHLLLRFGIVGKVRDRYNCFVWEINRHFEVARFVRFIGIDRPAASLVLDHTPEKQRSKWGVIEYDPIVSIKEEEEERVYDLIVEELHNFVAEDIIAHNTNFEELSRYIFQVTPVAAALGIKFEEVAAGLSAMTAQGVPTRVAATQFRQLFIELSKAGGVAATIFSELTGMTFKAFIASGKSVADALKLMEDHSTSLNLGINDMFSSVEAGNAALMLSGTGMVKFTSDLADMADTAGAVADAFSVMDEGPAQSFARLKTEIELMMVEVGTEFIPVIQQLIPVIKDVISVVGDLARWFGNLSQPTQLIIIGILGIAAALGPVLWITGGIIAALPAVMGLFGGLTGSVFGLSGAFAALNISMGPVMWLLMAIAGIIMLLMANWEDVVKMFSGISEALFGSFGGIVTPNIEGMETGGIVPTPRIVSVAERGPEAIIPLSELGETVGAGGGTYYDNREINIYDASRDDVEIQLMRYNWSSRRR